MSNAVAKEQSRTVARDALSILSNLMNLRRAAVKLGLLDEVDELEQYMRTYWFYSVFDSATVVTIAGPQGVGKSQLTNSLLDLPTDVGLEVGEGSCEHVPIILTSATADDAEGYALVCSFNSENHESDLIRYERLTFDDARKRAINPMDNDIAIKWYVKDCPSLADISPLVVLPGLELDSPWEDGIRLVLEVSDIAIYTVDPPRKAQAASSKIESWMEAVNLALPPICVVTKEDLMSSDEIESFRDSTGIYETLFVGQSESKKAIQLQDLWERIDVAISTVPTRRRKLRFNKLYN